MTTTALLLIAHGSRRDEANTDLDHLAAELARRGRYPIVEYCYLELATPDIAGGGERCVAGGADQVLMMPYFLSAGVHVVEDLEAARRTLQKKHPSVRFHLCEPIGRHPLMIEVLAQRAAEAEERP